MVSLQKVIVEEYKKISTLQNSVDLKQVQVSVHEKRITILENEIEDLRQLCQEAEKTLNNIKQSYDEITKRAKQSLQKAKELSNGFTPDDEGFNEFREEYDQLCDNLEELQQQKNEIFGRMECLNLPDENEMREYEARQKLIEELENTLRNDSAEINNITSKMRQMESGYCKSLQELVDQISSRFSAAFERMGCAGDVSVYTGEQIWFQKRFS